MVLKRRVIERWKCYAMGEKMNNNGSNAYFCESGPENILKINDSNDAEPTGSISPTLSAICLQRKRYQRSDRLEGGLNSAGISIR